MDSRDHFYGFSLLFNIFAEKKTYYAGIKYIKLCSLYFLLSIFILAVVNDINSAKNKES